MHPLAPLHCPRGSAPHGGTITTSGGGLGVAVQNAMDVTQASAPVAARTHWYVHPGRDGHIERMQLWQLHERDARINELRSHICRLEASERRLKAQVLKSDDRFANKDAELGEVTRALQIAEERLDDQEKTLGGLIKEVHQYQGWWLNEYYCLKVALKLARNQNDKGVKAMKESSHAWFMKWSGSHQP
ncbi:hypothetical protein FA13DRAFT_1711830 [Coprinellus micaceus]|uniref:Uncharacterized protein n=1 Tax=Coprinellus micaceus TaxID=71717 RepID=A0A4Y7T301_COPMI|nr:hypothetical protein FA13DRAFT_1711830 [Coprinellus micaceus]